ncbi:MAG: phenylalanine--tRNA ligase subunit beta [Patescibacteria group bacterium]|nr:phenylalanine--tRNA ligase subunit beta [Patescibacteria group bacterium]MDE2116742.1 phenylalanine--tRNA ligase subunit beta [Patescibacteria group bacterium]
MKISYNWLASYFKDKSLPAPERLAGLFNIHFAEVEAMEKIAASDGVPADTVLDIKTLPDRNHYALSHLGVAIEAGAIIGAPVSMPHSLDVAIDPSVPAPEVKVKDDRLCRRYMARRIYDVKVAAAPAWIRARLEAVGARSINSIVDATNYVMFDIGQPLHAFDADKVKGALVIRPAKAGEKMTTLDEREVELSTADLVIADDIGPLAIAGVKGGKRAEVTVSTRSIILESANFDPTAVRRTSTRIGIRNDSSKRFENEITPDIARLALDQVTALILETSGGKAGAATDVYPKPLKPWTIETDARTMNAVIGISLSAKDMADILTRLGCVVETSGDVLRVTPPLMRIDLAIAEDLADEIARMYGYDKLAATEPPAVPQTPVDKTFYWTEFLKNALVKVGYSEIQTYSLVKKGAFEIAHPLASDKSALRERISPKLAESLSMNALNADLLGLEAIKIFEIGKVFPRSGERTSVSIGALQVKKKKGTTSESILKEALAAIQPRFGPIAEKIETGAFGAMIETDLDAIIARLPDGAVDDLGFKPLSRDIKYKSFSAYPFIARDIALFVPAGTADAEVGDVIAAAAKKAAGDLLVKGPDLFDRFEKDGKTSYAFRMIFQASDRTLSDQEANSCMDVIYAAVRSRQWKVR